jgi:hypothetical protein
MNHLDCPLCAGHATIDDGLRAIRCDACGISVDVAPDPAVDLGTPAALDEAA